MAASNTGTCFLCKQEVTHRTVIKHIEKCLANNRDGKTSDQENIFLIKVFCGKEFWLFIEINSSLKLEDLDDYFREIWLECCGHMSQFNINGRSYSSDGEMKKALHKILNVDDCFDYEYDFGSTTELEGKVVSSRPGHLSDGIRLIARNHLPKDFICCKVCSKKAVVICPYCFDLMCKTCKKGHGCDEEDSMLPVVNSPRVGVCGYIGPD